jgi:5-methylcytosine-specific restriction endonuclease McrA
MPKSTSDIRHGRIMRLVERDGTKCIYCQIECCYISTLWNPGQLIADNGLTIEHLIPISLGGSNEIENLAVCCNKCNNQRGNSMDGRLLNIFASMDKKRSNQLIQMFITRGLKSNKIIAVFHILLNNVAYRKRI